jgi:DNA-binding response OmpR family regulator
MIESNLQAAPIRVLSVEDDIDYERLIEAWLDEKTGPTFEVTPAEGLEDVARHFQPGGYDVMLLDLGLPDGVGLDTVTIAREIASDLPIVVLTSDIDSAMPDQAIQSGADRCLIKGAFQPEALAEAIVEAVDRRRADPDSLGFNLPAVPSEPAVDCPLAELPGENLSLQIAQGSAARACSGGDWWDRCRRSSNWPF